jgi:hypothetical protein
MNLAFFQVKAIAFPIPKSWLDPKTLSTPSPSMSAGLLVRNKIAWAVMVLRPINQQMHWAEDMFLREPDIVQITPLAAFNWNCG